MSEQESWAEMKKQLLQRSAETVARQLSEGTAETAETEDQAEERRQREAAEPTP